MKSSLARLAFLLLLISFGEISLACDDHKKPNVAPGIIFIENQNQWADNILFKAKIPGGQLYLEEDRLTFDFDNQTDWENIYHNRHDKNYDGSELFISKHSYQLVYLGSEISPNVSGISERSEKINYFKGNDSNNWAGDVNCYEELKYLNLYKGIDLHLHENDSWLKYDYIIAPGANPMNIQWAYDGLDKFKVNKGELQLETSVGKVIESKPIAYQYISGVKTEVVCNYLVEDSICSFQFPNGYDSSVELIIDPTLVFSSFTGSSSDNWGYTACFDDQGNMFTGGIVFGSGYPTKPGAYQTSFSGGDIDIVISKFNSTGTNLVYSTYLGGNDAEAPHSLIVDGNNNLLIMGSTSSTNFPTSSNGFDQSFNGGVSRNVNSINYFNGSDIFITKLNSNGSNILGSTYLGGSDNDGLNLTTPLKFNYGDEFRGEINVDAQNNVYIASTTLSSNFPTTSLSVSQTLQGGRDGCVTKFSSDLSSISWSSYLGGSLQDAAFSIKIGDGNNRVFICGGTESTNFPVTSGGINSNYMGGSVDGFVVSLFQTTGGLSAGSYIGTSSYDQCFLLELDKNNDVYLVGQTKGNYPTTGGVYSNSGGSTFIHKLNPQLSSTKLSTKIGSGGQQINISPTAFLVDVCDNIYVSGWGGAVNNEGDVYGLPITGNAYQSSTDGNDFYFIVLDKNATSLVYGSYFGGNSVAEHVDGGTSRFDKQGVIYQAVCAGCGGSDLFPTTAGVWSQTNNSQNCNLGAAKIEFNYAGVNADADVNPLYYACSPPFIANFNNTSNNATNHYWEFGDGGTSTAANPTHTYISSGTFQVMYIASDPNSCNLADTTYLEVLVGQGIPPDAQFTYVLDCKTLTVTLSIASQWDHLYDWDMGDGTSYTQNASALNHTYASNGSYTITLKVRDTLCNTQDLFTQIVDIPPAVIADLNIQPATIGCIPFNVQFINSSNGLNYEWKFGDGAATNTSTSPSHIYNTAGTFDVRLIAIDPNTCNIRDTIFTQITAVAPSPVIADFVVEQDTSCFLLKVHLTDKSSGNYLSRIWDMNDGMLYYNDTLISHSYPTHQTFLIELIIEDSICGLRDTITQSISVRPGFNIELGPDQYICDDDSILLAISLNNVDIKWSTGSIVDSIFVSDKGTYKVRVSDSICVEWDQMKLLDPTNNHLGYTTHICYYGDEILIDAGDGGLSYSWNIGGDSRYILVDAANSYVFSVIDSFGCPRIDTIIVESPSSSKFLYVPNAFTPNGDLLNELFSPIGDELESYEFTIFNRWGDIIYITTNISQGWDGKSRSGNLVPQGVYVYKLLYKKDCGNDKLQKKFGHFTLIR